MSNPNAAAERRAKQTVRNLVYALLVTLLLVLVIILGVPRDDSNRIQRIDYVSEASKASEAVGLPVIAPGVPDDWWSNSARLEETAGVSSWHTGFVTPDNQFVGLKQAFESNPSWVALTLERNWYERDLQIAGFTWQVWPELRPSTPPSTMNLAMLVEINGQAVVIYGTASEADFIDLATSMAPQLALIQEGN